MVFVNGQKFACERPLHEIKKKGRPSTQCAHCKELRKAKQVNARCICGREEGSAAVANGLKRAKSLSHDGRLSVPAAIGGEDLLRPVSNQARSPHDSADAHSSTGGVVNCGCHDGMVCASCRDHAIRVPVKSNKGSPHSNCTVLKDHPSNRQRSTASLDLGKSGMMLFPRDSTSPLSFPPHAHGGQSVHSPDSLSPHGMNGTGIYANGTSPLLVQTLSPSGSNGCDHSPSSSSMGPHGQMQSSLCFDYASSSDYDSDHYPTTSYSYFPETLTSYPVSNASDDMDDMDLQRAADSKKIMDGIMNGTTTLNPMESASADEIRMLYSALSSFSAASPPAMPTPPTRSYSSPVPTTNGTVPAKQVFTAASSTKKAYGGSGKAADPASPVSSVLSHSPSAGRSEFGEDESSIKTEGCGCAISPNMCCCGERCACPGCLAFPNNWNMLDMQSTSEGPNQATSNSNSDKSGNMAVVDGMSMMNHANANGNLSAPQALNSSANLNLLQSNGQAGAGSSDFDVRQALKQEFSGLGPSGLQTAQMQHPTHIGDDGVLICGCGCGRPTVDCAECFRDICQFASEYQAKMLKDDLDFGAPLRRDAGNNRAELGLPMNMAMNLSSSMDMDMNMSNLDTSNFSQAPAMPQTMSLLSMQNQRSNSSPVNSPAYEQQQQQQVSNPLQKQLQTSMQLTQQMHQRLSLRSRFQAGEVADQKLPMQLMGQEQQQQRFVQHGEDSQVGDSLLKQQQNSMQLEQQMRQRQNLRLHFREGMEEDAKLQMHLMEHEQMQLQQLQQSMPHLNPLQLEFLDDQDWSFVNEIRMDGSDVNMNGPPRS
ncbi:hypothetical protein BGZ58_010058 [Dissophora ornata]|nr:hypothetical protein BGZ58_010058 [Dissophora ornata]